MRGGSVKIAFLGNFGVSYSSESHHAASLEQLGHEVVRLQEPQLDARDVYKAASNSDLFVWVHTHGWNIGGMDTVLQQLRDHGIPSMTYHLDLWIGLQRQRDMRTDPYWQIDHFFTVDRKMADYLNTHTAVRGHYLPAAVYGPECYKAEPTEQFDVAFVGSYGYHPEWSYRPKLIDWLKETYGHRFRHYGGGGLPTVRGAELNQVYANAKVVVGDSLCLGFTYPDYWSDRVYETLGRGGFLIHPFVAGMEQTFVNGKHLMFYNYGDFNELETLINTYRFKDTERTAIRDEGHEYVKNNHTYAHRWREILETLFGVEMLPIDGQYKITPK